MNREEINKIYALDSEISKLGVERTVLINKLKEEFLDHPQWPLFLERHGVHGFNDDMGGHQYYTFYFDAEDTCYIRAQDVFRSELVSDDFTRPFKMDELLEFLSNKDYYTPVLNRLESIKKACEKKAKEDAEKEEYNLYQRLKGKYEKDGNN